MSSSPDQLSAQLRSTGLSRLALAIEGSYDPPTKGQLLPPPTYAVDSAQVLKDAGIDQATNNFFATKLFPVEVDDSSTATTFQDSAGKILVVNFLGLSKRVMSMQQDTYYLDADCLKSKFPLDNYPSSVNQYTQDAALVYMHNVINQPWPVTWHDGVDSPNGARTLIAYACLNACSLWEYLAPFCANESLRNATRDAVLLAFRSPGWIAAQRYRFSGGFVKNFGEEMLHLYIKTIFLCTDMQSTGQPLPDGSAAFHGLHLVDIYNAVWDVCYHVSGESPENYLPPYDAPLMEDACYSSVLADYSRKVGYLFDACINRIMPSPEDYLKLTPTQVFNLPANPNAEKLAMNWCRVYDTYDHGGVRQRFLSGDPSSAIFDAPPRPAAYTTHGVTPGYTPQALTE